MVRVITCQGDEMKNNSFVQVSKCGAVLLFAMILSIWREPLFAAVVNDRSAELIAEHYRGAMRESLAIAPHLGYTGVPEVAPDMGGYGQEMLGFSGTHAQLIRLLAWISSSNPADRKNLLLSWFVECDPSEHRHIQEDLLLTVDSLNKEAHAARSKEIGETIKVFENERMKWRNYRLVDKSGIRIGLNFPTGIYDFDIFIDLGLTNKPLAHALFYMTPDERRHLYNKIPFPPPNLRESPSEWLLTFQLYMLLWRFEPDARLRRDILLPRLEASPNVYGNYWVSADFFTAGKVLTQIFPEPDRRYWDEFARDERNERLKETRPLQSKWLNQKKEQAEHEKKVKQQILQTDELKRELNSGRQEMK